jgi:FlaA1/EpsC-like NDP-sugar epimerase
VSGLSSAGFAAGSSWDPPALESVLGRPEHRIPVDEPLQVLRTQRIAVTGASGSIGQVLVPLLEASGIETFGMDIESADVREELDLVLVAGSSRFDVLVHLAGTKDAPEGELDPWRVCETNVLGTRNVIEAFPGAKVVLASTCKAADPETAYGASKLLAERMVLNAGGVVARLFNVVETAGNVFEQWAALPEPEPLPVAKCSRFFITLREALALLLWATILPTRRYGVAPGPRRRMEDVAKALYPRRPQRIIEPRRGDRRDEPVHGGSEHIGPAPVEHLVEISSPHDPGVSQPDPAAGRSRPSWPAISAAFISA